VPILTDIHAAPGLWLVGGALLLALLLRRAREPLPWRVALTHLALVVALLWPVLLAGRVLLPLDLLRGFVPFLDMPAPERHGNYLQRDLITLIAPAQAAVREALLAGEWPLRDDRVGAGVPLLGDPQAQALQPLVLLALPFDVVTAAGVVAGLRLLVALAFTFLLLRRSGVGEGAALAGSLAWGCGGWMMLWLGWPLANTGALLPLALWATARWFDGGSRLDAALVALSTAALALAGHPETELYAGALVLACAIARRHSALRNGAGARADGVAAPTAARGRRRVEAGRSLAGWLAAAALGALLAAPALLLAADAAASSQRAAALAARRGSDSAAIPGAAAGWQSGWASLALGRWLPVAAPHAFGNDRYLAYWGPENVNEDAAGFVGTLALLLAAIGFAPATRRFPGERVMQAALLAGLLLMALPAPLRALADGLPLVLQSPSYYHRLLLAVGFALVVLAACSLERAARGEVGSGSVLVAAAALAALLVWAYAAHAAPQGTEPLSALREGSLHWHLRVLAAGALLLLLARRGRTAAALAPWLAAVLVTVELLLLHAPANPPSAAPAGARSRLPRAAAVDFLRGELGDRRMVGTVEALPPNAAALYRLPDARAHAPMAHARCAAALAPLRRPVVSDLADGAPLRGRLARAGVGLVLAPPLGAGGPPPGPRIVFADTSATVYELPGAWPRRGLLDFPDGTRRLITTLCDDGGWRLLAGGRPAPTGRDDGAFLGALLPGGGEVHLLYRPRGFLAGAALGAAGLALLLLVAVRPPRASSG
jgi:hypothetical protein